jgi:antitoxin MazE
MIYICLNVYQEAIMQVSKWGNSLAIRLPAGVVEALELKEGDDIEVRVAGSRILDVEKKPSPEEWLQRMRRLRGLIPADFKFDRDEANAR